MKKWSIFLVAGALYGSVLALSVTTDFNDLSPGVLSGQSGGSGFTDSYIGVTNTQVVAGNLASSLHAVSQSGPAQSIKSTTFVGSSTSQIQRNLDSAMGGTIWISLLGKNDVLGGRGGFSLNPTSGSGNSTANAFNLLFYNNSGNTTGTVNLRTGSISLALTGALSWNTGDTALMLLRIQVDAGGNETVQFWFNPNVSTYSSEADFLANVPPTLTHNATDLFSSISSLGLFSYTSGAAINDGATLDSFRMSNDANAFQHVTGIATAIRPSLFVIH